MRHSLLTVRVVSSLSLVSIRDRTRHIAELFELDDLQRTRFTTAVSEVARNALQYAGKATLRFYLGASGNDPERQCIAAEVSDEGPGFANAEALSFSGADRPSTLTGLGLSGSRRLADGFRIRSVPGEGTVVTIEMSLPKHAAPYTATALHALVDKLTRRKAQTPVEALEQQNHDMLRTLEELQRSKAELEAADDRKNEFLAMLAHELRNPLAAITLSLQVAARTGDAGKTLPVIERQTRHLARMVDDLLDVSRLTRGKVDLQTDLADLKQIVADAIEMVQPEIARRGHRVHFTSQQLPVIARVDVARMKQVFGNIIHNAARYTPQPDVIDIDLRVVDGEARLTVSDKGIGIAPDLMARVFDLFSQGDSGLGRHEAGLGIGLTIVRRLVADHHGSVEVMSDGAGRGSRFLVCLPVIDVPAQQPALPAAAQSGLREGLRVMLVDDNVDTLMALRELLEMKGCVCQHAFDSRTGITLAAAFHAEVYIVDIGLPDMNGFELVKALRRLPGVMSGVSKPLFIALSGYSSDGFRIDASEAGFDHFFSKPMEIDLLLATLATV